MQRTPLLVPRQVLLDPRLNNHAKLTYCALAASAPTVVQNFDWEVSISIDQLARHIGGNVATTTQSIEKLVSVGWVERTRPHGQSAAPVYKSAIPKGEATHRV